MEKIWVRGRVSDFKGQQLSRAEVRFYDENFKVLYAAETDEAGEFAIEIDQRVYPSVFICQEYKTKFLEYWHWNFSPGPNEFLDVKIDGLELYGMRAWETKPTYPGLMVFVRPMSLKRYRILGSSSKGEPIAIGPDLRVEDIRAEADGQELLVNGISKVKEYINATQSMDAYLIHFSSADFAKPLRRVTLIIQDPETGEMGMGSIDLI